MSDNRESSRIKQHERGHILDEATRSRRQKKALDALEKDNFQDDLPSFIVSDYRLQLNKKFQQKFTISDECVNDPSTSVKENTPSSSLPNFATTTAPSTGSITSTQGLTEANLNEQNSTTKRKKLKTESKLRFRKNFATLLEEERELSSDKLYSYFSICVPASKFPQRKFCSVCGFQSNYTCIQCGSRYCGTRCLQTHKDTRCLKWTC